MSPRANENSIRSFVWHQLVIRNNNHNVNRTLQAQGSAECQNEVGGLWESGIRPKARKHIQPLNHTGFTITSKELADTASEIKRLFPIGFWWTGNIPHAVMSTPAHRHQRSSGFNNSWEHITGLSTTFKHLYNIYLFEYLYFPCDVWGSARVVELALRKGLTVGSNPTIFLFMCVALRRIFFLFYSQSFLNDIAIDIAYHTNISIRYLTIFISNSNWYFIRTRMTRKQMLHRREKYGCIRRAYNDLYSPQCKERQGQSRNVVSEVICIWTLVCIRALQKTPPGVVPPNKSASSDAVKLEWHVVYPLCMRSTRAREWRVVCQLYMQEPTERESGVWCARRACKNQLHAWTNWAREWGVVCPPCMQKGNCMHEPTEREGGVWCAPCAC